MKVIIRKHNFLLHNYNILLSSEKHAFFAHDHTKNIYLCHYVNFLLKIRNKRNVKFHSRDSRIITSHKETQMPSGKLVNLKLLKKKGTLST